MSDTPPRHYRFEHYRLDRQTRELHSDDGSAVPLTGKALDTLCCLIDLRDRVVSKDELLAAVWPGRVVEENNLTQAISALRRALGSESRYIATVSGRGYRFVAEVQTGEAPVVSTPPLLSPPDTTEAHDTPVMPSRRLTFALAGLLCAAALLALVVWLQREPPPAPAGPMERRLAVLPFRSLSPGPRDELLELGLAETLIARISSSTSLRVSSLVSSQRFAGPEQDSLDAGRQLGVAYVVEGTSQRLGDRVRVNARLLAVRDGSSIWSGTFDEKLDRAFTLQDGIAEAVTSALALQLDASPVQGRSPCDGANAEAYRAYLTGRYQLGRPSAARMRQALAAFHRAIELDPSCARAYAGMAFAYRSLSMTGDQDPQQNFPLAKAAVKQALAIDPDSAEAYTSQGFIRFWYDWDWVGAEASFKRAIELNPSLAEARMAYAHLLSNLGRNDEAVAQARQAVALDPLSPLINTLSSSFVARAGHAGEAKEGWQRALELEPHFWVALLGRVGMKMQKQDYAGAIADLRQASELCGGCSQVQAVLGQAYALAGDRDSAERVLREMEEKDRIGYMPATSLATVHNALGDTVGALNLLERAYQERDIRLAFLKVDVQWNNLRTEPRFKALARRMGLDGADASPEEKGE